MKVFRRISEFVDYIYYQINRFGDYIKSFDKLNHILYLFFLLVLYGYLGNMLERWFSMQVNGRVIDYTFMYGPWSPIYGVTIILTYFVLYAFGLYEKKCSILKYVLGLIFAIIAVFVMEYFGGNLIEYFTGRVLWDYSLLHFDYPTGVYIHSVITPLLAIGAYIFALLIHRLFLACKNIVPIIVVIGVCSIFLFDLLLTLYGSLNFFNS